MPTFAGLPLTLLPAEFIRKTAPKKEIEAFIDEFEVKYTTATRQFLTDAELAAIKPGSAFSFDSECFINYWICGFKHLDSGKYVALHEHEKDKLKWILKNFLVVGFNSRTYDIPMCQLVLNGFTTKQLKQATSKIIFGEYQPYQIEQFYKLKFVPVNHIDLFEVAPLDGSLKLYAGRLHCKRMQDLPVDPEKVLTDPEKSRIKEYMLNDIDNTELLLKFLMPQLDLRYSMSNIYNVDLRSKSDAQIAEAVIAAELQRLTGRKPDKPKTWGNYFFYQVPPFVQFKTPELQQVLQIVKDTVFEVDEGGKLETPESIKNLSVTLGQNVYRLGMGGLHSSETTVAYTSTDEWVLLDRDVVSYYPKIILTQKLYPRHLGPAFLNIYQSIVDRRVIAKKTGDKVTNDSLKITINGSFGKLGNCYSILYSPELLLQVTMSGQLCLLLLIEMLYPSDLFQVLSANTDGILIRCRKDTRPILESIIKEWERITGFETEETEYSGVYARDVNNYIAIKKDGKVKLKGSYSERGSSGDTPLSRNPEAFICNDAVIAFLKDGTPVADTVNKCSDIRRFVVVRNVKGGATKSGKYLGKTVRWYYSTEMKGQINYVLSGNKVPNSDGARPLMELPEGELPPDDLDYDRYISMCEDILTEIGATPAKDKPQGLLFS